VIIRIDGFEVTDARSALYRLTTRGVGNTAKVDVMRNGRPVTLEMPLRVAPKPGKSDIKNLSGQHPLDGARVSNLLPGLADELGLDSTGGAVVMSVRPGSIAARLGFQPGDIVLEVQAKKIEDVASLAALLDQPQRTWEISVQRGGQVLQIKVRG
jgi:S1-C subfamily serine protease